MNDEAHSARAGALREWAIEHPFAFSWGLTVVWWIVIAGVAYCVPRAQPAWFGAAARALCAVAGRSAKGDEVIARIWRGWTSAEDADDYVDYLLETGMKHYRATAGNRAAYILRREDGDRTEFVTLSLWDDLESIKAFAGDDVEAAVFYPEDDRFLVDRETVVTHYETIRAPD